MNQQLLDELISMEQRDVDTRPRLVWEGWLYDDYADELQHMHREDAHRLNELVSQHDWPTISAVGRRLPHGRGNRATLHRHA